MSQMVFGRLLLLCYNSPENITDMHIRKDMTDFAH